MAETESTKTPFWTNSLKFWIWVVIIAIGVNTWVAQMKHNVYVSQGNVCSSETQSGATDLAVTCYENGIKTLNDYNNWLTWTEWIAAIGGIIFIVQLVNRFKTRSSEQATHAASTLHNHHLSNHDELESWDTIRKS